jgi:hypothetical protein
MSFSLYSARCYCGVVLASRSTPSPFAEDGRGT